MSGKASYWSITINNPTETDFQQWEALKKAVWVKDSNGQLEKGDEGTPHIQAYVQTGYGRFFNKLREALPRAHIEIAKNPSALVKYVAKEETRVGTIPKPITKVATQEDLQYEMYTYLMYNGSNFTSTWNHKKDFLENWNIHKEMIRKHWELILDQAVQRLIMNGYYGIEFVVSNNQVRTAFKKYLPEILYRTHATDLLHSQAQREEQTHILQQE